MIRSLWFLLGGASLVAVVDLGHKALAGPVLVHERSVLYALAIGVASAAWAAAVVHLRSASIAFAAGLLVGGAAGNVFSLAIWSGVPNPLTLGDVAFNVADLSVGLGLALLLPATLLFAVRNRARLGEPVDRAVG